MLSLVCLEHITWVSNWPFGREQETNDEIELEVLGSRRGRSSRVDRERLGGEGVLGLGSLLSHGLLLVLLLHPLLLHGLLLSHRELLRSLLRKLVSRLPPRTDPPGVSRPLSLVLGWLGMLLFLWLRSVLLHERELLRHDGRRV